MWQSEAKHPVRWAVLSGQAVVILETAMIRLTNISLSQSYLANWQDNKAFKKMSCLFRHSSLVDGCVLAWLPETDRTAKGNNPFHFFVCIQRRHTMLASWTSPLSRLRRLGWVLATDKATASAESPFSFSPVLNTVALSAKT